ncbi:MAG: nucleotidyltransferase domain-containing protein, partial [Tissierellia bacterium]|nr:nucleotidyltransferase domain-containing protein [Tissierellia bacterium]
DRAFIFGSYAKGNYNENSDIDLAIFSEAFKDMDPVEGIKFLLKRARKYADVDLQPIAFTKEDYDEPLGIVEDILETGIELHIS